MANIELVIKIPEDIRVAIGQMGLLRIPNEMTRVVDKAIQHGTPLPKGHGRLIDEKEINTVVKGVFNDFDKHSPETFLNVIHNQCIEAVGADKAESEG